MYQARVRMPRMGTSVHEGTIIEWKKSIGDRISKGEPLLSAESEKVEFEVESPADGILKEILAEAETTVAVGNILAILETEEEISEEEFDTPILSGPPKSEEWVAPIAPLPPKSSPKRIPQETSHPTAQNTQSASNSRWLSPRVQRVAADHGLDLSTISQIPGTGGGGRVTARDVERYVQEEENIAIVRLSFHPIAKRSGRETRKPFNRLRKRIAENLTRSARDIPQVTSYLDVDMSRLSAWRESKKDAFLERHGVRLTYTSFFVLAIIAALREPENSRFNSTYEADGLIIKRYVNLGLAVDSPDGLMVPVLHEADSLSFVDLVFRIEDLASRARAGALSPDEGKGGTITLTNFGSSGVLFGNPLINPPEVAIVGSGAIVPRVVAFPGGGICVRPIMRLALTFDHRANDGMAAGRFAASIRTTLEGMDLSQLEF